jgi:hypothetical protein
MTYDAVLSRRRRLQLPPDSARRPTSLQINVLPEFWRKFDAALNVTVEKMVTHPIFIK